MRMKACFDLDKTNSYYGKPGEYGKFILSRMKIEAPEQYKKLEKLNKNGIWTVWIDIWAVNGIPTYEVYTADPHRRCVDKFELTK